VVCHGRQKQAKKEGIDHEKKKLVQIIRILANEPNDYDDEGPNDGIVRKETHPLKPNKNLSFSSRLFFSAFILTLKTLPSPSELRVSLYFSISLSRCTPIQSVLSHCEIDFRLAFALLPCLTTYLLFLDGKCTE